MPPKYFELLPLGPQEARHAASCEQQMDWLHYSNPAGEARTLVMGILNVTPDSFSDGGRWASPSDAIRRAYQLIEEGADCIDIGAESTRPSHTPVAADEEWRRLEPVLKELCVNSPVPISVDTYKGAVADNAIGYGVQIVNDVWGGLADDRMLSVVADAGCTYIWMHNRNEPTEKVDVTSVLMEETTAGIERCLQSGIRRENLWIDPGIGFGKTTLQNLTILNRLKVFCDLGQPVLLGTSRKSLIGHTLGLPVEERLEGSLATVSVGVLAGVRMVRVHDVRSTVRTCRILEAITNAK